MIDMETYPILGRLFLVRRDGAESAKWETEANLPRSLVCDFMQQHPTAADSSESESEDEPEGGAESEVKASAEEEMVAEEELAEDELAEVEAESEVEVEAGSRKRHREAEPSSDEDEFVVDRVLKQRKRRGRIEYLVSWKGYDDQTWESDNIQNTDALLQWQKQTE